MIKVSKKVIAIITATTTLIIVGSTILANFAIKTNKHENINYNNPTRGRFYHYYPIYNKIANNKLLNNLVDYSTSNNQLTYFINENKFLLNLKLMVIDALKNISVFSKDYANYDISCKYKIISSKKIIVDLVWNLPNNNKYKFYDQFSINLSAT